MNWFIARQRIHVLQIQYFISSRVQRTDVQITHTHTNVRQRLSTWFSQYCHMYGIKRLLNICNYIMIAKRLSFGTERKSYHGSRIRLCIITMSLVHVLKRFSRAKVFVLHTSTRGFFLFFICLLIVFKLFGGLVENEARDEYYDVPMVVWNIDV